MTNYPPPAAPYGAYPPARQRPLGVTLIAILEILFGLLLVLGAVATFLVAFFVSSSEFSQQINQYLPEWAVSMGGTLFAALGVVLLIFAIVAFLVAWGFLKGKAWAWWLGIIYSILSIVSAVISAFTGNFSSVASAIIPIVILLYLMLPGTKAWFNV